MVQSALIMAREQDDDLYGMAADPKPEPRRPAPVPAAKVIAYQRQSKPEGLDPDRLRNLHAPLALFAAGLLVQAALVYWGQIGQTFAQNGIELTIGSVLMLIVFRACATRRGFDFGRWGDAILKVLAISVAPTAAMYLLAMVLNAITPGVLLLHLLVLIVLWVVTFCFYFALIGYFFELDQDDTWYCVIALFLTRVVIALAGMAVVA